MTAQPRQAPLPQPPSPMPQLPQYQQLPLQLPPQQQQRSLTQPTQPVQPLPQPAPQPPYALPYQQVPRVPQPAQTLPMQYPPYQPMMPPTPPAQPPLPTVRQEEPMLVSGDVHRAFKYAMIVGVPLAIGGIATALLATLALSIPVYIYFVMGISVTLLSLSVIIMGYSWFRSLRIVEGEINRINQRLASMQQIRQLQTQPRMMPSPLTQPPRYMLPQPFMQPPQPQSNTADKQTNSDDLTQG